MLGLLRLLRKWNATVLATCVWTLSPTDLLIKHNTSVFIPGPRAPWLTGSASTGWWILALVESVDELFLYLVIYLAEHDPSVLRVDSLIHDHFLACFGFLDELVVQRQYNLIAGILWSLIDILPLLE